MQRHVEGRWSVPAKTRGFDPRRVDRAKLRPAQKKPQGRAGVAGAWVHGAATRSDGALHGEVPRNAWRLPRAKENGRRPSTSKRDCRRGGASRQRATWPASAEGEANLKRGVRSTVHQLAVSLARRVSLTGAIDRTGGASSTRSARASRVPDLPERRGGGRGSVRRSARRRSRTTPLH